MHVAGDARTRGPADVDADVDAVGRVGAVRARWWRPGSAPSPRSASSRVSPARSASWRSGATIRCPDVYGYAFITANAWSSRASTSASVGVRDRRARRTGTHRSRRRRSSANPSMYVARHPAQRRSSLIRSHARRRPRRSRATNSSTARRARARSLPARFTPTVPCVDVVVADDEHVGHLLQLGAPDARAPSVSACASTISTRKPSARSRSTSRARVVVVAVGDRQHRDLHRREPRRERAGVVLDEDREEPLDRAEQRAVDHHRPVALVVGADVLELEALRELEVELDGRELPRATDRVARLHRDLRPVERAAALVEHQLEAGREPDRAERRGGLVPLRVGADRLALGFGRQLEVEVVEPVVARAGRARTRALGSARRPPARACRRCARRPASCRARASGRAPRPTSRSGTPCRTRRAGAGARGTSACGSGRSGCGTGSSSA